LRQFFEYGNKSAGSASKHGMNANAPLRREILDEDLQIVRVTLATISDDVRGFSTSAADAIQDALVKLDCAQQEFARARAL
jgi:hypothetical protein